MAPSRLPEGEPVPPDGSLPPSALEGVANTPLGLYLHVPFCRTRCGYCDFNTYTLGELSDDRAVEDYLVAVGTELDLARRVLGPEAHEASTVFVGGGTPTMLGASRLVRLLGRVRDTFGLAHDVEVTTEANPESIDASGLVELREGGFTRVSFGMQSSDPGVLHTLDRVHTPGRAVEAVAEAKTAGFEHISLDLIYGTPGETLDSWRDSVTTALAAGPDHLSAYALIVEEGTALQRRIKHGEMPAPDDDDQADKYELVDALASAAGLSWYEVSNWAKSRSARCHHNELYWTGANWWGIGPGAHSHVGGVRWWNVKHPRAYAGRLQQATSPAYAREVLSEYDRYIERVLLETRLSDGFPIEVLDDRGRAALPALVGQGLVDARTDRVIPTRRGRLLADAVVRELT